MSDMHAVLKKWLIDGRPEPAPTALVRHLESCDFCRAAIDEIEETRGWFPEPEESMSAAAAAAIRFQLEAEARGVRSTEREPNAPRRARRNGVFAVAAVAAAALMAAIVAGLVFWPRPHAPEKAAPATSLVQGKTTVSPSKEAVYWTLDSAPNEIYQLHSGSVRFSVQPRAPGQRVRVVVGQAIVEVRGTVFVLDASMGRLMAATVQHGVVSVKLETGNTVVLRAGDRWRREREQVSSSTAAVDAGHAPRAIVPTHRRKIGGRRRAKVASRARREPALRQQALPAQPGEDKPATPEGVGFGQAFHDAWQLTRAGSHDQAAKAFDLLLSRAGGVPKERRADVLFWSAHAHSKAGRRDAAIERLEAALRLDPHGWHSKRATALLVALREATRQKRGHDAR
jgi:hypothetical protein